MASINLQQQPKKQGLLKCYVPRPGRKLLYTDVNSLEPHVLAYYSRDPKLLSIYGPGAGPNCIYLWFGSATTIFKQQILDSTYDPLCPTKEGINQAKIDLAELRDVLKSTYLGCMYGLGAKNLGKKLNLEGFAITPAQAKDLHRTFWKFFSGIKKYEAALLRQYRINGGYIINGRGRPLTIHEDYTKDIVNRHTQSTGHDCLLRMIYHINNMRKERQVDMIPYLIDEHDATVWQIVESQIEEGKQIYQDAYDLLNEELAWDITIRGAIKVGDNLAVKL